MRNLNVLVRFLRCLSRDSRLKKSRTQEKQDSRELSIACPSDPEGRDCHALILIKVNSDGYFLWQIQPAE